MMRMLEFGGMPLLTDGVRAADEDNPHGYFEYERAKSIQSDPSFLKDAEGKAFKMVSRLLFHLPAARRYKVLFMRRDLDEMIASQNTLLRRQGKQVAGDDAQVKAMLQRHLDEVEAWSKQQRAAELVQVSYNGLLACPEVEIDRIVAFLEGAVNGTQMRQAIDPSLYRNRSHANS